MALQAILFDFNGVIINDESIHQTLIEEILLGENLRAKPGEYQQFCVGRSDRGCLRDILAQRGRVVNEAYLGKLIAKKTALYQAKLAEISVLPLYADVKPCLLEVQSLEIPLAIVTGALREEVELVLERAELAQYFQLIVSGDEITTSKPEPDGYLQAIARLREQYPHRQLQPQHCLAIEDSFPGIEAAKRAGIPVVGVAHTYPLHLLQRRANWVVDSLADLELDRIQAILSAMN